MHPYKILTFDNALTMRRLKQVCLKEDQVAGIGEVYTILRICQANEEILR